MIETKDKSAFVLGIFTGLFTLFLAEAWLLMLVLGGVWHETGWGKPISYAGAITVTSLLYVVAFIVGLFRFSSRKS